MSKFILAGLALSGASALQAQYPLGAQVPVLPQPGPELVSSEALQAAIKGENLLARAKQLYEVAKLGEDEYGHPTRVIGSQGHLGTLKYIHSELAALGDYYNVSQQAFPAVSGSVFESRLVLGHTVPSSASAMSLTPPTKDKQPVYGPVVLVANDGCESADFPAAAAGAVALIRRGTCAFSLKSQLAGRAGAVAAVVYNTDDSGVHGTLGTPLPEHVATFGLSGAEAAPFLTSLEAGHTVDAIAYVDAVVSVITTNNVLAQTAAGDPDHCVMLGGHSDSVAAGPGINDDGSGSLALLEVARQLARFSVRNCVRFAWWSGEEEGLLGSDWYALSLPEAENLRIRLFMDYDMLASPNFAYQVYDARNGANPRGSQELRDLYIDWYAEHGINNTFIPFDGRSDYVGFILAGIPAGGIATGAEGVKTPGEETLFGGKAGDWYDPCYHQLCDDVANVNVTAWELNTKLVAHSVATFAASFDDFPKREKVIKPMTPTLEQLRALRARKPIM